MYQYRGYRIVHSSSGFGYTVYSPSGRVYGPFGSDKEAENFVDNLIA